MILHDCPYCRGSGKVPLNGVYLETLQTMRRLCKRGAFIVANRDAEK